MAIGTAGIFQCIGEFCLMTFFAFNLLMLSLQLEIRFTVVKILNAFDNAERLPGMALGAVLTELIVVWIRVAWGAVFKLQSGEFLEFLPVFCAGFMTCGTGYQLVFAG